METQTYFNVKDVAEQLGVSYYKVWYSVNISRRIKPLRVGHSTLFTAREIDALRTLFGLKVTQ